MWDRPRLGFEPTSPALAGRFSTTVPPGKPQEGHFIVVESTIHQEDIKILSVCTSNNRASKYMATKTNKEINKPTIIVRDFNIPFSVTNRTN